MSFLLPPLRLPLALGIILILLLGAFGYAPLVAAADDLAISAGSWVQIYGEGSLNFIDPQWKDGRIWLEAQSRWDEHWTHWYQGMARAALGYSLSDRATVWMGYTFLPTQNIGKPYFAQQDLWPAFRYTLPTEVGTFTFRTMWETNFIVAGSIRERPRQMIRFTHPFDFEPRLTLVAWDEVFVRVNSTPIGGQAGFDQNRAFLGAGWSFNPDFRVELGYLNQYVDNAMHTSETMRNLIVGSLFINF